MSVTYPVCMQSSLCATACSRKHAVLFFRQYVTKENRSLVPTSMGRVLSTFLKLFFSTWVDVQFTAGMETQLDQISAGEKDDKGFLKTFWSQLCQSLSVAEGVDTRQVLIPVLGQLAHHSCGCFFSSGGSVLQVEECERPSIA